MTGLGNTTRNGRDRPRGPIGSYNGPSQRPQMPDVNRQPWKSPRTGGPAAPARPSTPQYRRRG